MKNLFLKVSPRGFALITALWVIVVMIILSTALIATSTNTLFLAGNYKIRKQVTTLAECGINEAMAHLINDKTWGKGSSVSLPDADTPDPLKKLPEKSNYYVTFDTTRKHFSVNNLTGSMPATGYRGRTVPPYTANLICVATAGGVTRIVDVFVQPANDTRCAILAQNKLLLNLKGTINFSSENSGNPLMHSNADANDVITDSLMTGFSGRSGRTGNTVTSSVSQIDIPALVVPADADASGEKPCVMPRGTYTKLNDSSYSFHDEYNVTSDMTVGNGTLPGVNVKDGRLVISKNQIASGTVTVRGDLAFESGAYLQLTNDNSYATWGGDEAVALGSLSMSGTITGNGSVVAERDVTFDVTQFSSSSDPRSKINIFAGNTVTMVSKSDKPAEFSGMIYAGKLVASEITDGAGNPKDLTLYGGVFVKQNTLDPLSGNSVSVVPTPVPTATPTPVPTPTPGYSNDPDDDGGLPVVIMKSAKMMLAKSVSFEAAPAPVITDGDIVIENVDNLNIIYDEDYLNVINAKQSYSNYNIASWTEYSE